ncbi:MAG: HAD family hydrolase [Propionicimonas sp.]|uniref:HAD family hydrolase n=1 Tax=Propionicimonas sp. TaxID=1955623 RepID=UPI003D0C56A3
MTSTADRTHLRLPDLDRPIRLVASDLDGTLLVDHRTVSARSVAAIDAAGAAGVPVVVATGRQVPQVPPLIRPAAIRYVVGSNGSIAGDLHTGEVLFEDLLPVATLLELADFLTSAAPGVGFSAVRDHGAGHAAEPGYLDLLTPRERDGEWTVDVAPLPDVLGEPTLKLTARHPRLSADDLLAVLAGSGLTGFHATTSGAPFLEIGNAGVTKASGVARLCDLLGVDRTEVAAFGDAKNDIELLTWAGLGVAMGNAVPEALAAADWQTASSDDDGVARGIELILRAALTRGGRPSSRHPGLDPGSQRTTTPPSSRA